MPVQVEATSGSAAMAPAATEQTSNYEKISILKKIRNTINGDGSLNSADVPIFDIRSSKDELSLRDDIINGIVVPEGQEKTLPTIILYDSKGLKEFERITYADEYYLTNTEIQLLQENADRMAERIEDGSAVVELGSGAYIQVEIRQNHSNLRKVNILLHALEKAKKEISYFALDLSLPELKRTFEDLPKSSFKYVKCYGLHGTYDDGRKWLTTDPNIKDKPKCILWLGSSIGNFDREDATSFMKEYTEQVLRPGSKDIAIVAADACKNPEKVWSAYNDGSGITNGFIMNGLDSANHIMGEIVFDRDSWSYIGEYQVLEGRHQASYRALKDINLGPSFKNTIIKKDEMIRVERSHKYSLADATKCWEQAGLSEGARWDAANGEYSLFMLYRPSFNMPLKPSEYAAKAVPSIEEWRSLWAAWDLVTRDMITDEQLLTKPIPLRNPIVFYFGHIPYFLDMQLHRVQDIKDPKLAHYHKIFERGIDPDVNDPEKCHRHSEVPTNYPSRDEIANYQFHVRKELESVYKSGVMDNNVSLQRAVWLGFEHECMHMETLLYMLLQDGKTLAPKGVVKPDFKGEYSLKEKTENFWLDISAQKIKIGEDDCEESGGYFGWDNERPSRTLDVKPFKAAARPITNGEYARFLEAEKIKELPASWSSPQTEQSTIIVKGIYVKTVFGLVPLQDAINWPVLATYDELSRCAQWLGGRIPSHEELRAIYEHIDEEKADLDAKKLAATFNGVNGHLCMNGIHISPPPANSQKEGGDSLFSDLSGGVVGFKFWHLRSVVGEQVGRRDVGAWEWTSTVLEKHEGFKPMPLYPEYTVDFFDAKHNIVLGGSWATHPRIAGRKSFVNWYQRNYPYAWTTARIVKDI